MNRTTNKTDELADQVLSLLEAQKESLRAGDYSAFEKLAEQMEVLISELAAYGGYPCRGQQEKLKSLYDDIRMCIEAEKASIETSLVQVRGNKKLVKAYKQR